MKILFIDYCEHQPKSKTEAPGCQDEFEAIEATAKILNAEVELVTCRTSAELKETLESEERGQFDIIYLTAHGFDDGFALTSDGKEHYRWADFATENCGAAALKAESVLYLGCCFGGSKGIAQILFLHCDRFGFVAGCANEIPKKLVPVAFLNFLVAYMEKDSAAHISRRVSAAISRDFQAHRRSEMYHELVIIRQNWEQHRNQCGIPYGLDDCFLTTEQLHARF